MKAQSRNKMQPTRGYTHPLENHGKGNNCTGPTKSTVTSCELIQLQAMWYITKKREPVHMYTHCTPHAVQTKNVQRPNTH